MPSRASLLQPSLGPAAALSCALAFALAGCPQSIETPGGDDAGPVREDATTFPDAAIFPDATTFPDAAEIDDAGEPADATQPDAETPPDSGVLRPLTWSQMTLPPNTASIGAIWGRSSSEIYAGTSNGNLLRFDPATGWTVAWHEPSNFGIHAIWGTPNKIFVASDTTLHVHNGAIQQVPVSYAVGRWIYDIHGLNDNEVYIVSDLQNGRALFKYDGNGVDLLIEPNDTATLGAVYVPSSGRVFVGGNGHLFRYESFVLNNETVAWESSWSSNDILQFNFWDISAAGSKLFAMGSRYLIFERDSTGVWQQSHTPFLTDSLHALAGYENEAYAVGNEVTGGSILRYYQNTWTTDHYDQNVDLQDIWSANPDEYYTAGNLNNMIEGVLLRGSRP